LRARKIGTQHVIEEQDLERLVEDPWPVEVPEEWKTFDDGTPQPDWERLVRESRDGH
jgi:hypothetical protein